MESSDKTRRTISQALRTDSLSAEARAFLAPEGRKPVLQPTKSDALSAATSTPVSSPSVLSIPPPAAELDVESAQREEGTRPSGVVSMTFRLPAELPAALVRASAERKVRKQKPFTQQDIVAEAVQQWLRTHGFLY